MKTHPLLKELDVVIMQCVVATAFIMCMPSCASEKVKPVKDTIGISLQDSMEKASMDADKKASLERFWQDKKAKAEWEAGKNGKAN